MVELRRESKAERALETGQGMTNKERVTKIQQTHTTEGVFLAVAQQQINQTSGRGSADSGREPSRASEAAGGAKTMHDEENTAA